MPSGPHGIIGSVFWRAQAQRFLALREETRKASKLPLGASYYPEGWGFDDVPGFAGSASGCWMLDRGTPATKDEFKGVAGVCAVALGAPNSDLAWVAWLDCLRRDSPDFEAAEIQMSSLRTEPRPEADFEVLAPGLLMEPFPVVPDPEPQYVLSDVREFDDVCAVSERVCRKLTDESLRAELASPAVAPIDTGSRVEGGGKAAESEPTQPADMSATRTPKEAADALKVSEDTIHRMRRRGEIGMFKVGAQWRTTVSEILRLRQQPKFRNR